MARPLTLLLVRHGQSEWNALGLMQGQTADIPLTDLGHAQAAAGAAELAALGPGALISSDLLRARQTAEHCARATGLPVAVTPALREQGYGVLEGRPSRELWDVVDWTDPHWAAEGGESLARLHGRVAAYLEQLRAEPPADVVALVTHGDTIRAVQAVAAGLGPAAMPAVTPPNGSVTRVELVAVRWTGPFESAALLTALPVPARLAPSTRGVLRWAPLVGLVLGGLAAGVAVVGARWISPLVGAVLAVAVLALLTRGLHLDGLADTADGLGPLRDRERALQVMHQGDVGPFGVVALVLTLLLQVACAAALLSADGGWLALWSAVLVARLAMMRTGLPGVAWRPARRSAGRWRAPCRGRGGRGGAARARASWPAAGCSSTARPGCRLLAAAAAGLLAAEGVHRRATARLGGTTGDVDGGHGRGRDDRTSC